MEQSVDVVSPYLITSEDKNIAKSLVNAKTNLVKVKNELAKQGFENFPFRNDETKKCALAVVQRNVNTELAVVSMMTQIVRTLDVLKEQAYDEDALHDMCAMRAWLAHVVKLSNEHIDAIFQHLTGIITNCKGREEEANLVFQNGFQCAQHQNEKAIAKSIDGKKFICKKCFVEETI